MRAKVTEKCEKTRFVPLTPPTVQVLKDWLKVRPDEHGDWMFMSLGPKANGAFSCNGVIQMLKRRAKHACVVGPVNPHSFRHGYARDFLMDGGDLGTLSDLMGHEGVETTKNWYGIFTINELQEKHNRHSPVINMFGDDGSEVSFFQSLTGSQ